MEADTVVPQVRGAPCIWIGVPPAYVPSSLDDVGSLANAQDDRSKEGYTPAELSSAKEEIVRLNSLIDHLMSELEDPTSTYTSPSACSALYDLSITSLPLPKRRQVVHNALGPSLGSNRSFLVDAEALLSFANSPTSPRRSQFAVGSFSRTAGGDIMVGVGITGTGDKVTAPTDPTIDATSSIVASSDASRTNMGETEEREEIWEKQSSAYEERYDLAMTRLKAKALAKAAVVA